MVILPQLGHFQLVADHCPSVSAPKELRFSLTKTVTRQCGQVVFMSSLSSVLGAVRSRYMLLTAKWTVSRQIRAGVHSRVPATNFAVRALGTILSRHGLLPTTVAVFGRSWTRSLDGKKVREILLGSIPDFFQLVPLSVSSSLRDTEIPEEQVFLYSVSFPITGL